jgi:hypothetical protein
LTIIFWKKKIKQKFANTEKWRKNTYMAHSQKKVPTKTDNHSKNYNLILAFLIFLKLSTYRTYQPGMPGCLLVFRDRSSLASSDWLLLWGEKNWFQFFFWKKGIRRCFGYFSMALYQNKKIQKKTNRVPRVFSSFFSVGGFLFVFFFSENDCQSF